MGYKPDTKLRDYRKNGQVVQPFIENPPDNNGWPEPLTDPSVPYQIKVNDGQNGEQTTMSDTNTSQSKTGGWHLSEGESAPSVSQPGDIYSQRGQGDNVSQKAFSEPGGPAPEQPGPQWLNEDEYNETLKDPFKTIQQIRGEHHKPEGE